MSNNSGLTFLLGAALGARYWKFVIALIVLVPVFILIEQDHNLPWNYIISSFAGLVALKLLYEVYLKIKKIAFSCFNCISNFSHKLKTNHKRK